MMVRIGGDGNLKSSRSSGSKNTKPRWDSLFVKRTKPDGRIYVNPDEYGEMYTGGKKERKSIPVDMRPKGRSKEAQFVKIIAIATYLNRDKLSHFEGIIVRSKGKNLSIVASESDEVGPHAKEKVSGGSTDWIAYISPEEDFYRVKGKELGEKLDKELQDKIQDSLEYLEEER